MSNARSKETKPFICDCGGFEDHERITMEILWQMNPQVPDSKVSQADID